MTKILIVDDEPMIIEILQAYLEKEGYTIYSAANGAEAIRNVRNVQPDLMILDLMLPDISGQEVCKIIRLESDIPILMLTAKSSEEDRIHGIVIGADDYVTKPFSPREVVVRIQAILRRVNKKSNHKLSFNHGELYINQLSKEVISLDHTISLTPIEYKILTTMAQYPNRVYSRTQLLENIHEDDTFFDGDERTIDTHIKNLRKKLEKNPRRPELIITVFGMGYKFGGKQDV